jgi:hypothetical protein
MNVAVPIILMLAIVLATLARAEPVTCIKTLLRIDCTDGSTGMRVNRSTTWWNDGSVSRREDFDLRHDRDRRRLRRDERRPNR